MSCTRPFLPPLSGLFLVALYRHAEASGCRRVLAGHRVLPGRGRALAGRYCGAPRRDGVRPHQKQATAAVQALALRLIADRLEHGEAHQVSALGGHTWAEMKLTWRARSGSGGTCGDRGVRAGPP